MKSVFPITVLLSLTLITACGGGSSSSSGGASYAQKNSSVCITDQKEINRILEVKKDVIISDGCLKKGSVESEKAFLTDVNLSMRIDVDVKEINANIEKFKKRHYENNIEYSSKGITLEEFKKGVTYSLAWYDKTGVLKFNVISNSQVFAIELVKPTVAGKYTDLYVKHMLKGEVKGIKVDETLEGEMALTIEVKDK